jgi:hypothetical protein
MLASTKGISGALKNANIKTTINRNGKFDPAGMSRSKESNVPTIATNKKIL